MAVVIGWDIGGAHLKGARLEAGKITAAAQVACPLWLGLEHLDNAFAQAQTALDSADRHAVTMTGELADAFASRPEGVQKLTAVARRMLAGDLLVYAGRAGFVDARVTASHVEDIASANWHATASLVGRHQRDGLLVDLGSTTTDLIPIVGGSVHAQGYSDAQRLVSGELVYTGLVRSFVMALAERAPIEGRWLSLMNENFANAADLYRILERLPEGVDQHATADGREKTVPHSLARLARMVGREADDLSQQQWVLLAQWFAEAQLRKLTDAAMLILSRSEIPTTLPVIMAGIGDTIVAELARRLRRPLKEFSDGLTIAPAAATLVRQCAPAVAVAYLAGASD
jgi:(4-(4-[2-(gamma-L-glutamylamino)ethyl]phenoxymethyl)furan-2-yl)methanamine synthase